MRRSILPLLLLTALAGCGDSLPERVPVSGTVTIDGKPVPTGTIQFAPVQGGRLSAGAIDADGRYTLTTYTPGDGCAPGEHVVTVQSFHDVSGTTRHWLVPKKYAIPATSGLKISIDRTTDQANFQLTWNGKTGPEIERN